MPYRPNLARKIGNCARNRATAPRRAAETSCAELAGLMGMICAKASSEAKASAMALRNAAPFRFPSTDSRDVTATRNNMASCVRDAISPANCGGSCADNKAITHNSTETSPPEVRALGEVTHGKLSPDNHRGVVVASRSRAADELSLGLSGGAFAHDGRAL